MPHRFAALTASVILALVLVACGDDDEGTTGTPKPASPSAASPSAVLVQPEPVQALDAEVAEPSDGVVEVTIEGAQFRGNNVRVTFGESVKIDVTNRDAENHNLRIAGFDGEYQTEDDAIVSPNPIEPNGAGSLDFVPLVAGAYTFRCDYHPGTMGGRVTVQ
jgi:plastocyanin